MPTDARQHRHPLGSARVPRVRRGDRGSDPREKLAHCTSPRFSPITLRNPPRNASKCTARTISTPCSRGPGNPEPGARSRTEADPGASGIPSFWRGRKCSTPQPCDSPPAPDKVARRRIEISVGADWLRIPPKGFPTSSPRSRGVARKKQSFGGQRTMLVLRSFQGLVSTRP